MLRFFIVMISCFFLIFYYVPKMSYYAAHSEKYSEHTCYQLAVHIIEVIKEHGKIETKAFGKENLPEDSGYIMYVNHQGKYDALGIMSVHKNPCTVIMDEKRSRLWIVSQFVDLIRGKRLCKDNLRQQIGIFHEVVNEVKEGRKYIVFPEAGYYKNQNALQKFNAGCFKMSLWSKCPIVPVAIFDSYKPFTGYSVRKVTTQVHFLEPIEFQQFAGMSTTEICDLVAGRIQKKLEQLTVEAEGKR